MKALRTKPLTASAPGISPRFEEGKRGWMTLDKKVTFSNFTGVRNYRKEAKQIWITLDMDRDGSVSEQEIFRWCIVNKVFAEVDDEDSLNVIKTLFRDIDTNGSGELDFDEFFKFYTMVQHEKTQMQIASRHHITALPPSVVKYNKESYTTEAIEVMLQDKIQQYTSQDSDRLRHILKMFKTQVQRSKDHTAESEQIMGVTERQFKTILMWLGLFATDAQAKSLFRKYDINGDGCLTVHEFLTCARAKDYPGRHINVGEKYSFRTGKRMYLEDTLNRRPVRPQTPNDDVFHVSEKTIAARIRAKMGNLPGTGHHYNETPLALNALVKIFEYYDPSGSGRCGMPDLKRGLENLNLSVGDTHLDLLMDKFPSKNGGFDYMAFCMYVYPGKPVNASLPQHTSLQLRKHADMRIDLGSTGQFSKRNQRSGRSHISSRSGAARLAHSSRLQPLSRRVGESRGLAPSASMQSLSRENSRGGSRGLAATGGSRGLAATASMQQLSRESSRRFSKQ